MKKYFYKLLIGIGVVAWIAETAYFGWNKTPINAQEQMADIISQLLIFWGFIGDISQNLTINKPTHNNINTKSVIINGKPFIKYHEKTN